ncbi:hypothetical protein F0562_016513 [Nyssa sinensis]|uniref:AMP-activated protein kinase glycogen-binding domain-containing protein n=1 Tax=Nyssa sinensis TaxID=561372 RepID=A0A5J4ZIX6_9ASTE|nr:hypothetical protein F0562_016513 [Nyssa sinensis]
MATLFHIPNFFSLSSHKLHHFRLYHHRQRHLTIYASSAKKPRASRKVRSNADICNDIREFLTAVGLPEDHVPSMKELSQHGRQDLANIVRRRGYKVIGELLSTSTKMDSNDSDLEEAQLENRTQTVIVEMNQQDEKLKDLAEDVSTSSEVSTVEVEKVKDLAEDVSVSSEVSMVEVEKVKDLAEDVSTPSEVSTVEVEKVKDLAEDVSVSSEVSMVEVEKVKDLAEDVSLSSEVSTVEVEKLKDLAEDVSLSSEVSTVEVNLNNLDGATTEHALNSNDQNFMSLESSINSSLQEKVANFIQNGELDTVEDNSFGILNDIGSEESKGYIELENMREFESSTLSDEHSDKFVGRSYAAKISNGSTLTSEKVVHPASGNDSPKDGYFPGGGLLSAENDEDLDVESRKRESQIEINRLKFMLHQKELELSQLMEQIEKEKLALSVLQTKAETEISIAQNLILEKDAELQAAEESLSGLEEVQIQYWGDGETVEVAGSFNGWHHRIKMDPQPSSSVLDPIGSRKSRLWTTVLWLYPGTYEIKFIVDGHWKIDPQRNSVTRGTIQNNILQVDR